ncbi:BTAD domain-containing putative transcriptional regulator [Streptomyces fradiae]|uniref:AfsR/SARP family transcriptional regulator n=1 Tax=Streptomyces fradiae TaxID=1906 RepID=UPI0033C4A7F4
MGRDDGPRVPEQRVPRQAQAPGGQAPDSGLAPDRTRTPSNGAGRQHGAPGPAPRSAPRTRPHDTGTADSATAEAHTEDRPESSANGIPVTRADAHPDGHAHENATTGHGLTAHPTTGHNPSAHTTTAHAAAGRDAAPDGETGGGCADLRFGVLGPVRAWCDGRPLPSGSPQQRALLAALLLRDGRTATAAELIDGIWGDEPPSQALAALRTYASRLRKVLPPDVLVTESGGYAIRCAPDALDLHVAQELAAEAEKARASGDRAQAVTLIGKALGLWDGEPLASVPGPYAETQRARLEEWRLQLVEARLDLDLECGHHAEAVSELTALTAAHPLRERLRELLMLALYRSGRQAEALAVYADTRRLLADELGVDPRPELARLQQRILRADSDLAQPVERPAPAEAPVARPAQLPATVPDFTGRSACVQELSDLLSTAEGSVMAVSALAGIGGVGKTTLAVHVAHQARPHFPDGQLYVDLMGAGARAAEPETVLGSFLRALGTPDSQIPETLDERAALYRSTLAGRRVLVLLDNARDAAQVRPLLPGTEGCAALVTSRIRMLDLAGAHLVDLDVMSPDEALQLFTRIVGAERVRAEREAALDVVAACGFLPLAIRIAASRLAARRTWTVSVLAAKLADERRRLDELQAGDLAVKATFELGYGQLEPAQARAFRLLGLADGPDMSLAAAAAVLDLPPEETEDLLESLVDTSLLESAAPGRYRFHDLVRLYARVCAERDEQPPAEREAARSRLLDFYLATAARVYAIERPGDRLVDHLEPTTYDGLAFTDRHEAQDWLYREANCVLACVRQATACGTPGSRLRRAVDLLWAAKDLTESGANSKQYESAAVAACEAARAAGDTRTEGRARTTLSNVHLVAGRYDEADREAREARDLAVAAGDPAPVYWADNDRGIIAIMQGRYEDAEAHLVRATDGSREVGNLPSVATALCNLSRVHLLTGRSSSAIDLARQGIEIYDRLGLTMRLANGRYALGVALSHAERHPEALEELAEALRIFTRNRQRLWEGATHFRIAEARFRSRQPARAAQHAEQALALGCIGGDRMRGNILVLLGKALRVLGQTDRARACLHEALALYERMGASEAEGVRALLSPSAAA